MKCVSTIPSVGAGSSAMCTLLLEYDRRRDLTLGDCPVGPQQLGAALRPDQRETAPAVERDRPAGRGPRPDEHAARLRAQEVLEQRAADAAPLACGRDVGVADQHDVAHRLDAHDAGEGPLVLVAPEPDAGGDLVLELV